MSRQGALMLCRLLLVGCLAGACAPANVVAVGDSITRGASTLPDPVVDSYPYKLDALLNAPGTSWSIANRGISGGVLDDMAAAAATDVDAIYQTGRSNYVVLLGGSNDIEGVNPTDVPSGDVAAEAIYQKVRAYCLARRDRGWRPVVMTILARVSFATFREYTRKRINTLIRENWQTFADGLVDLALEPTIGVYPAFSDGTYFLSDMIHPNGTGNDVIAGLVADKLRDMRGW